MPKYRGPKEQLDAALSLDTPVPELKLLAKSDYNFVRIAVAENPNTASTVLAELFPKDLQSDANQYMAVALARNAKTAATQLSRLAEMVVPLLEGWNSRGSSLKHFELGVALCNNKITPIEAVINLLHPEHSPKTFRKVVARETKRKDVLHVLLQDRSETIRMQVEQTLAHLEDSAP